MLKNSLKLILAQRVWQGLAGVVTMYVITVTLTQEQQGWYYTFLSLAALYSLFEMGLSAAMVQVSAKMFVRLQWLPNGRLSGDGVAAFSSFLSQAVKTYGKFALVFAVLTLLVGIYIFSQKNTHDLNDASWLWPWVFMVTMTAANMLTLPLFAVVEGSGQVAEIYFLRLIQGVLGAVAAWCVLLVGGWLWAAMMMPLAGILVTVVWLKRKRADLIQHAMHPSNQAFNWTQEIWPLQWRIGLSWMSVFIMSQLSTPILFYYQDSIVAGQIGLSLTIAHMLGLFAQSWVTRHVPVMSQLVAKKQWESLDRLFKKDFIYSLGAFFCGALLLITAHYVISKTHYATRVLPLAPFVWLVLFVLFFHINGVFSIQLRSFQKEPLVWISFLGGLLTILGSVYIAKLSSVSNLILWMLAIQMLFVFPITSLMWRQLNKKWRD